MFRFADLLKGELPVLVFFYSPNSLECTQMNRVIKQIAIELRAKIKIVRINILKNDLLAQALRIKHVPTMLLYKNDIMIWRQARLTDAVALSRVLQNLLD
ncbi:thioredoxin family protein [Myroides sp. LJL115]